MRYLYTKVKSVMRRGTRGINILCLKKDCKCNLQSHKLVVFNTSLNSDNLGDQIIMDYANEVLNDIYSSHERVDIPTHTVPMQALVNKIEKTDLKFIVGTNILSNNILSNILFEFPKKGLNKYQNSCLMAVGWAAYENKSINAMSIKFYNTIFTDEYIHSVRDSYTESKLKKMGIKNVINTSCVTLWNVDEQLCSQIPKKKAGSVVTTITDYDRDIEKDRYMLQLLKKLYNTVYIWPQGEYDLKYLNSIVDISEFELLAPTLQAYDDLLRENSDLDYVGTRLHGGIRAINSKHRSIIIAIDNRAVEIAKDTRLPICERSAIKSSLEDMICLGFETRITIPKDNIEKWKRQFKKQSKN